MSTPSVADLRKEYTRHGLTESDLASDPIDQFNQWLQDAVGAELEEPNAMTLATATSDGRPSARIVLLKGVDERGFVFYTNYESRKGQDIAANPHVSLTFLWKPLERQVRIEGLAERVPDEESEAYFQSRPRGSRLGAWASPQSDAISGRDVLTQRLQEVTQRYEGQDVPRPPHWGGFLVRPTRIEFWQGRPNRLHDRFLYTEHEEGWASQRLAP